MWYLTVLLEHPRISGALELEAGRVALMRLQAGFRDQARTSGAQECMKSKVACASQSGLVVERGSDFCRRKTVAGLVVVRLSPECTSKSRTALTYLRTILQPARVPIDRARQVPRQGETPREYLLPGLQDGPSFNPELR